MRLYPAPYDEARMQRWVAWNQQHDAEHGHGLWAVILRATGECIGDCGLVPQQVDGVAEACFPKPELTGRRMWAEEFRKPFFPLPASSRSRVEDTFSCVDAVERPAE